MLVDLWTDVVCPWCYIGVSRFDRALEQSRAEAIVRIHPFQLDPDAPVPGIPARERYRAKFGAEADAIVGRVTDEARRDGLRFDLDSAVTANTFDAHRAIAFAARFGAERRLERSLYEAYFVDGLDVSDRDVLAARAAAAGVDRAEMSAFLQSDAGVAELAEELDEAFARGITAVPTFVFEEEFAVPGAVDTATFVRIIEQMRAMNTAT